MASKDSSKVYVNYDVLGGSALWYTHIEMTGADKAGDSTKYVISYSSTVYMRYAYLWGVQTTINGETASGVLTTDPGSSYKQVCKKSGNITVNKKSTAYDYTLTASSKGATVSGYGPAQNTCSVTLSISVPALPVTEPSPVTNLVNTRNSDSLNVLTWTNNATATGIYDSIYIERSTNGGTYNELVSIAGSSTSYNDTTTSANNYYTYRVRPYNSAGYAEYATSGATYNTPNPPSKIVAARSAAATVVLSITNTANTATGLLLEKSATGIGDWEAVGTYTGKITTLEVNAGGGTWYFRAKNTRGDLISEYSPISNAVITIVPPNPPTLVSPTSGMIVSTSSTDISFSWIHNPLDGSAQTAAQLRYSTNGGSTYTTKDISGSTNSYILANTFTANTTVQWSVRTKGADANYGDWASERFFYVYQTPSVSIERPTSSTFSSMPLTIEVSYNDISGSLVGLTYTIAKADSPTDAIFTKETTSTVIDVSPADWLPEQGVEYSIIVNARSSTGLSSLAIKNVSGTFLTPQKGILNFEPNIDNGSMNVIVSLQEIEDGEVAALYVNVYRVVDGKQVCIAENTSAGVGINDKFAPLNKVFHYLITTVSSFGAIRTEEYETYLQSPYFYFYNASNLMEIAKARWNVKEEMKLTQPSRTLINYIGRRFPVSYNTSNRQDNRSFTALLETQDEADAFTKLWMAGGRCLYKNGKGDVFYADTDITLKPLYKSYAYGDVSIDIIRIAGGGM